MVLLLARDPSEQVGFGLVQHFLTDDYLKITGEITMRSRVAIDVSTRWQNWRVARPDRPAVWLQAFRKMFSTQTQAFLAGLYKPSSMVINFRFSLAATQIYLAQQRGRILQVDIS